MPEMLTGKKTQRYSTESKVKAVEWSHQAHRSVKGVAEALDIHPFMLSRWRLGERLSGDCVRATLREAFTDVDTGLTKPKSC
ncbi:transposase [Halomonas sp. E14]|uniref:transposase n=1 Tax=Halomonas sp. E14 TaxID=3397245 RepID=UPI00403E57EC